MNRFALVLFSLSLGAALIGCSGKKEQAEKPKEAVSAPAEVAPEKTVEKVEAAPAPEKSKEVETDAPRAEKAQAAVEKVKAAEKAVEVKAAAAVKAVEKKAVQAEKAIEKALAPAAPASSSADAAAGVEIYKKKCAPCHGVDGKGTSMAPALRANEWVKAAPIGDITGVIKNGRQGKDKLYPKFFSPMPASKAMSDDDLGSLAAYLKSLN